MKEYKVINEREMKKTTRIYALIAGMALIVLSIFIRSLYTGLVGFVIIMAVIYKKELSFTEEGYLTTYDFILFSHRDLWAYKDISDMHREVAPNRAYMGLLVQKDMAFKRAILPVAQVEDVLSLAKSKNPKIHIGDVNK